jgi:orotidine-5'-phosphate decarboxylase
MDLTFAPNLLRARDANVKSTRQGGHDAAFAAIYPCLKQLHVAKHGPKLRYFKDPVPTVVSTLNNVPEIPMASAAAEPGMTDSHHRDRAREKLIVALDFWEVEDARKLVRKLGDEVSFYKVGLGLQLVGGNEFARELIAEGKRVFLDYKYYDIEETVQRAVAQAAELKITFLTVHGVASIMKAAVAGRGSSDMKILGVTVLTSMDAEDIKEMGFECNVEDLVIARAKKALEVGVDGVVASALEAAELRKQTSNKLMIVSPGIRPSGGARHDQKRVATPFEAIRAGADYLVLGRPIYAASDPKAAAQAIIQEMADALRTD